MHAYKKNERTKISMHGKNVLTSKDNYCIYLYFLRQITIFKQRKKYFRTDNPNVSEFSTRVRFPMIIKDEKRKSSSQDSLCSI